MESLEIKEIATTVQEIEDSLNDAKKYTKYESNQYRMLRRLGLSDRN
ncbi:MAG: hypothetical protein WAM14_15840 [Candidatus Nitrosopolaris sp.]